MKILKFIGYGILAIIGLSILSAIFNSNKNENDSSLSNTNKTIKSASSEVSTENKEEDIILKKLKAKANRDWPNDYTTQEYWINEQIEAYHYMNSIPEDNIKKKAQKDWPLDFTTQKFWYDEQIEAKERLK